MEDHAKGEWLFYNTPEGVEMISTVLTKKKSMKKETAMRIDAREEGEKTSQLLTASYGAAFSSLFFFRIH